MPNKPQTNRKLNLDKAYNNKVFLNSPDARIIRMLAEYLEPESRFRKNGIEDTVVFFGSARMLPPEVAASRLNQIKKEAGQCSSLTPELRNRLREAEMAVKTSVYYRDAVTLSSKLTTWSKKLYSSKKNSHGRRFIVCSGGGPGIMEAANRGASEAKGYSIGLNISLPYEQIPNPYMSDELAFEFHYFFIRKFWFTYLAKALVIFPGGFGTIDEMMELLTLIQTEKITKKLPIILYDPDHWKKIINFEALLEWGMISPQDLNLVHFSNSPEEAFDYLKTELESIL